MFKANPKSNSNETLEKTKDDEYIIPPELRTSPEVIALSHALAKSGIKMKSDTKLQRNYFSFISESSSSESSSEEETPTLTPKP